MPARTAEGVIAKLVLASPYVDAKNFHDDMADDILASAAIDARALEARRQSRLIRKRSTGGASHRHTGWRDVKRSSITALRYDL